MDSQQAQGTFREVVRQARIPAPSILKLRHFQPKKRIRRFGRSPERAPLFSLGLLPLETWYYPGEEAFLW
jgi:hypothetical protein